MGARLYHFAKSKGMSWLKVCKTKKTWTFTFSDYQTQSNHIKAAINPDLPHLFSFCHYLPDDKECGRIFAG